MLSVQRQVMGVCQMQCEHTSKKQPCLSPKGQN